jgi:hypothetical protein
MLNLLFRQNATFLDRYECIARYFGPIAQFQRFWCDRVVPPNQSKGHNEETHHENIDGYLLNTGV